MITKLVSMSTLRILLSVSMLTFSVWLLAAMNSTPSLVDSLAYEDGPVEWVSAVFLLIASIIMLVGAGLLARRRKIVPTLVAVFLALIFFVICMEEIS